MVLTNPPFGHKSSILVVGQDGDTARESINLPAPGEIAEEIAEDLRGALEQIEEILGDLEAGAGAASAAPEA